MIELIFVIVIIGILAAVAIPKLSATRDDAKISNIVANARTALGDITGYYTSQGQTKFKTALAVDITNVPLKTSTCADLAATTTVAGTTLALCDDSTPCVTINTDANGTSTTFLSTATATSAVCVGVSTDTAMEAIAPVTPGRIHLLGGASVAR
jgi:type II secretory pathway pseudopilin PulG